MVTVRPMRESDAAAVDALWAGDVVPFSGAAMAWKLWESIPGALFVAEDESTGVVGYASLFERAMWRNTYAPVRVKVEPAHRGQGIGEALWGALAPARDRWADGFFGLVDEADEESRRTLARHGVRELGLHIVRVLDLTTVEEGAAIPPPAGVTVHRPQLDDPAERDHLYRFLNERGEDAPDVGRGSVLLQREQFDLFYTESWQTLLLRDGEDDVALTIAVRDPGEPTHAHIMFTGVVPSHRGRGLATWIKQRHAAEMRALGFVSLRTENMSTNTAILRANERAGFRVVGGYLDVVLEHA